MRSTGLMATSIWRRCMKMNDEEWENFKTFAKQHFNVDLKDYHRAWIEKYRVAWVEGIDAELSIPRHQGAVRGKKIDLIVIDDIEER